MTPFRPSENRISSETSSDTSSDAEHERYPSNPPMETNIVLQQVLDDLGRYRTDGKQDKVAETLNSLGLIRLHMQQDPHRARQCHEEALSIYRHRKDTLRAAMTMVDLGFVNERCLDYKTALELYVQAIQIMEQARVDKNYPCMASAIRYAERCRRQT